MNARRLRFWEEIRDDLLEIHNQDGSLIATIGKIDVALPVELGSRLKEHIGHRIAILRTDLDFRVRCLTEESGKDAS